MISSKVYKTEQGVDITRALKRFNRKIQKESILTEFNERRFFKSESSKRREMIKHAKYINQMNLKYNQE